MGADQRIVDALMKKPRLLERVLTMVMLGKGHKIAGPWESWGHTAPHILDETPCEIPQESTGTFLPEAGCRNPRHNRQHTSWTRRNLMVDGKLCVLDDYTGDICRVIQTSNEDDTITDDFESSVIWTGTSRVIDRVAAPTEGQNLCDAALRAEGWLLLGETT